MKLFRPGDKSRAVCDVDGIVSTTFEYRDVPFADGKGQAKDILVGACDKCRRVLSIPPQSTPAIKAAREKADISIEASLPAVYAEALDLACYRIAPGSSRAFRKPLLMYYVHTCLVDKKASARVTKIVRRPDRFFTEGERVGMNKRLSLKISPHASAEIDDLTKRTKINRTQLFKSLIIKMRDDIITPKQPRNLRVLQTIAATVGR
ncbi:MAG: hypothetical protein SFV19_09470 [Rhodospirillaceae bacterium]|nr:hypothetical protein [Rhodospirillaceae bacterium]